MNADFAYLIGLIIGNGEIQRRRIDTTVSIEIPHKVMKDDEGRDILVYIQASLLQIEQIIKPLISADISITTGKRVTTMSFTLPNANYTMREINRYVGNGVHHSTMTMNEEIFNLPYDERIQVLRGIGDVTGYIRKSNSYMGMPGKHRVYIEVPHNWQMVIDIANLMKSVDVPVQTIDFAHPNFRDSGLAKYNQGYPNFWKKEHQLKIWANEYQTIGFNIKHKKATLEKYANENLQYQDPAKTHRYYWETKSTSAKKPHHPGEDDEWLPDNIRGKHYDSWKELAAELGYKK